MKPYRYIIAAAATSALLFSSCDDMLDMTPETDPSDAVIWNSAEAFEKGVNQFYTFLPYFLDKDYLRGIRDKDLMSDLCLNKDSENSYSNSTYTPGETDKIYDEYFKNLRAINYYFKNEAQYGAGLNIARYTAEAHFFRAYTSFRMFKEYGPLPIVKSVMDVSSPELYGPRASRNDFADFIIADLEEAIGSGALPLQKDIEGGDSDGRITLGAAQALLAEVCLFEGTWQRYHYSDDTRATALLNKAAEYAKKVMDDTSYHLFYNEELGVESYKYMFSLESTHQCNPANVLKDANKEYIFRNRFDENVRQPNQNVVHGAKWSNVTRKFVEMFLDLKGQATRPDYETSLNSYYKDRDPRLSTLSVAIGDLNWNNANASNFQRNEADSALAVVVGWNGPGFYVKKWSTERGMDANQSGFDCPIIRLAEVYLIYAEAKCELGGGNISDGDLNISLNLLRDRVHMPHLTNATVPEGSTLLEEIRKERTRELYLEGFRFDDLRRWKTAEKEMSENLEGVYIGEGSAFARDWSFVSPYNAKQAYNYTATSNTNYDKSADGYIVREAASRRTFTEKNYLLPLPTKQLELNPALEQNPGW